MKEIGKMGNNLVEGNLCLKMEKNMMEKYLKEKHLMRFLYNMELNNQKKENKKCLKIIENDLLFILNIKCYLIFDFNNYHFND